jgi:hypothetical protein
MTVVGAIFGLLGGGWSLRAKASKVSVLDKVAAVKADPQSKVVIGSTLVTSAELLAE